MLLLLSIMSLQLLMEYHVLLLFSNKVDTAAPVSTSQVSVLPETSRSTPIGLTEGLPIVSVCNANSQSVLASLNHQSPHLFPALLSTSRITGNWAPQEIRYPYSKYPRIFCTPLENFAPLRSLEFQYLHMEYPRKFSTPSQTTYSIQV